MIYGVLELGREETRVIEEVNQLHSQLSYTLGEPRRWGGMLRRDIEARNIRGSNTIEGYRVTMEMAVAAVNGEKPRPPTPEDENWLVTEGYQNAMTYVLQKAEDPAFRYSPELLKALHYMMVSYDLSKRPGRWRVGPIFVHEVGGSGERVYEGPWTSEPDLFGLIDELVASLNENESPPLVRAALAHLNLVMIHPFADGNGRMGRCLQTLVLARSGVLESPFSSIEEYLGKNTPAYYAVLAQVGGGAWHPERDARPWIRFCLKAHYQQAMTLQRRTREVAKLFNELESAIKRAGLPERTIEALGNAALGQKITNSSYRSGAEVTDAVAGYDFRAMVRAGFLIPHGEKRARFYLAGGPVLAIKREVAEPQAIPDPFAEPELLQKTLELPGIKIARAARASSTWPPRRS
jgi:Fic family protein